MSESNENAQVSIVNFNGETLIGVIMSNSPEFFTISQPLRMFKDPQGGEVKFAFPLWTQLTSDNSFRISKYSSMVCTPTQHVLESYLNVLRSLVQAETPAEETEETPEAKKPAAKKKPTAKKTTAKKTVAK